MTIDELKAKAKAAGASTPTETLQYAVNLLNDTAAAHNSVQSQLAGMQQRVKDAETRYGAELIARQRYQLELEALKKQYGVA